MIAQFQAFFVLFHQGKSLANSATWKNRTLATNGLIALLGAAIAIAKGFGYDFNIDDQTTQILGAGIVAFVGVANNVMHVITSDKVGLPPAG